MLKEVDIQTAAFLKKRSRDKEIIMTSRENLHKGLTDLHAKVCCNQRKPISEITIQHLFYRSDSTHQHSQQTILKMGRRHKSQTVRCRRIKLSSVWF